MPVSKVSAAQIVIPGWPRTMKALLPGKGLNFVPQDKAVQAVIRVGGLDRSLSGSLDSNHHQRGRLVGQGNIHDLPGKETHASLTAPFSHGRDNLPE